MMRTIRSSALDRCGSKRRKREKKGASLLIAGLYEGEESRCDRQSVLKEFKQQIITSRLSSEREEGRVWDMWSHARTLTHASKVRRSHSSGFLNAS